MPITSIRLVALTLLSLALPATAIAQTALPAGKPVIVSGTVPDEATRQSILASVRAVYGAENVVDQLGVGSVVAPPNWTSYVQKLITPDLKQISSGGLNIDGNNINVRGEVTNEAQRQQLVSDFAMRLNPTYVIKNGLRVGAGEQQLLDKTLANRIVEFESGSSKLAPQGAQLLDEMAAAILRVGKHKIQIVGHTDSSGHPDANQVLSQSRAEAVRRYLMGKGLEGGSLEAQGMGANEPIAANTSADGRARNRRIEFRIVN
ncbi:OmpA family protein [Uliginosibacterium sp. H3]|uniref:OmpA family protein n=1 Tax=Uliginosibacterium silvisoli TaxID=3114758 RepID=A0ABU6K657_9RHOO|nr:OmpA family protein [Uliginosibacterium sp. H3]